MTHPSKSDLQWGLMAEFTRAEELVEAVHRARAEGYTRLDAYSPSPIEGLAEALGFHKTGVARACLFGGVLGGVSGYLMQWYCSAVSYPVNIAGRPLNDTPTFIPITFEMTILFAGLFTAIGMLFLNGLPQPYHPVFNVESFAQRASRDRFFLVIEKRDPKFDTARTRAFLEGLSASGVYDVER